MDFKKIELLLWPLPRSAHNVVFESSLSHEFEIIITKLKVCNYYII